MFIRACKRADVATIRLHDLGHTMATLALQASVHPSDGSTSNAIAPSTSSWLTWTSWKPETAPQTKSSAS